MKTRAFFDADTYTLTYVVYDPTSRDAIVIDPVLDYDPKSSQTSTGSVDEVIRFIDEQELNVHHILETHAHADHLSSSQLLKKRFGAGVGIGSRITEVQETFSALFDLGDDLATDGSQFERLLNDGDVLAAGTIHIEAIATPGHTPACMTYKVGGAIYTGDALFMPDYGVGRCDFPRGSAEDLYESVHEKLYRLPDETRVFVGHDYQPGGRPMAYETTIQASKLDNVQLREETTRQEFVSKRVARDKTLAAPRLLLPSVQVNANAGCLPKRRENGRRYLSVPINWAKPTDDVGSALESPANETDAAGRSRHDAESRPSHEETAA